MSLEEVVRLKHSYRMLLADRVKPDLLAAVKADEPGRRGRGARRRSCGGGTIPPRPGSRGAMLFEIWFQRYAQGRQGRRRLCP